MAKGPRPDGLQNVYIATHFENFGARSLDSKGEFESNKNRNPNSLIQGPKHFLNTTHFNVFLQVQNSNPWHSLVINGIWSLDRT